MTATDVCAAVFLRFYDAAGVRQQYSLPEAQGLQFTDELAGDGMASYAAPLLAQAMQAHPDMLENGICRAALVLGAGEAPTEVFAWELVPTSGKIVAELADKQAQCNAPGLRHLLSYAPVFPEVGGFDSNTQDARMFGWMSAQDPSWYNSSDWVAPTSNGSRGSAYGYPDPSALMITGGSSPAAGEVHLFRATFTLIATETLRIFYQGDDTCTIYVNSKLCGEQSGPTDIRLNTPSSFDITLPAGTHTIAAAVTNLKPSYALNWLSLACTVVSLTGSGSANQILLSTDLTHWKVHKVVGSNPGYTAAGIFLKLLAEAQALGVYGLGVFTPDFTHTLDSAGNTWPDLQERAFPIAQTSLLDVVHELESVAFDLHIKPDGTVQAFLTQGSDVSATVWFKQGVNLLSMTYRGSPVVATHALVRSLEGWGESINTAGEAAYGKRYIGITSGVSASIAQGSQVGDTALQNLARPVYLYTAVIQAVTGAVPWRDFKVGDTIKAPARGGVMTSLRVVSISASTPGDVPGPVTFTVELDLP